MVHVRFFAWHLLTLKKVPQKCESLAKKKKKA